MASIGLPLFHSRERDETSSRRGELNGRLSVLLKTEKLWTAFLRKLARVDFAVSVVVLDAYEGIKDTVTKVAQCFLAALPR